MKLNASVGLKVLGGVFMALGQAASVWGGQILKAPEFNLTTQGTGDQFRVLAKAPISHHFNLKAPFSMKLVGGDTKAEVTLAGKPGAAESTEIQFKIDPSLSAHYRVEIYVCDDAKTFCERHRVEASWDKTKLSIVDPTSKASSEVLPEDPKAAPSRTKTAGEFGFLVNAPELALAQAKREQKPLMIDFFGIWCPPCNELDEEVFSTHEFRKKSGRFVQLKLDSDSEVSWQLKTKYRVGGYPTVVFTSADGEEILRIVGFRNEKAFLKLMDQAWASRDASFAHWESEAKKGDRLGLDKMGLIHLGREDYALAAQELEKSTHYREKYFDAWIGSLNEKKGKDRDVEALKTALQSAVQEFPKSVDSIDRFSQLAHLYEEKKDAVHQQEALKSLIALAQFWVNQPEVSLEGHDLSRADLWTLTAESYETLNALQPTETHDTHPLWMHAAQEYKRRIKTGKERGYHLELANCYWKAKDYASAEKIYQKFEHLYPEEFTFYFSHARMKMATKDYISAETLTKKALQYAYGDNRLRTSYVLAKAAHAQGNNEEAKQVLDQAIQSTKLPDDARIRTHDYLGMLIDFKKELGA